MWPNRAPDDPYLLFFRFFLNIYLEKSEQSSVKIQLQMIYFFRFFVFSWTYYISEKILTICWKSRLIQPILAKSSSTHFFRFFVFLLNINISIWKNLNNNLAKSSFTRLILRYFPEIYMEKSKQSAGNIVQFNKIWNRYPDNPLFFFDFSFFCFFLDWIWNNLNNHLAKLSSR